MRGWICHLKLLLVLTSSVILRSESCRTHDHILLSQIQDSPNLQGQVPVSFPPRTGWPGYTPRHWVLSSSPPTTHRATVEVFDTTTTWIPRIARILKIESNSMYRNYKELAHMTCLANPFSQPTLDTSPI
jgi:hypothetical protein